MTAAPVTPISAPRRISTWTAYGLMLRWTASSVGPMLPFALVAQMLFAGAIIVGFGYLGPEITGDFARTLSSGAPTFLLLMVGLVFVSNGIAQAKQTGSFTFLRSQPVPRSMILAADITVFAGVALPAVPVSVLVAELRFDVDFSFDWPVLLLALVASTVMASSLGYAMAAVTPAMLTQIVAQVLVVFVMLFSPITFPASRLPGWMQTLHEYLPFEAVAELVRASLFSEHYAFEVRDLLVIAVWAVVGLAVSMWGLARRG